MEEELDSSSPNTHQVSCSFQFGGMNDLGYVMNV
jgi:hypothetical protein